MVSGVGTAPMLYTAVWAGWSSHRMKPPRAQGWALGQGGSTCEDWGKAREKPGNKAHASWKQKEMVLPGKVVATGAEWARETELAGDLL